MAKKVGWFVAVQKAPSPVISERNSSGERRDEANRRRGGARRGRRGGLVGSLVPVVISYVHSNFKLERNFF